MQYLKIQNNGLLDIRLLSLMGGTTKANDSYKIGQWGSGLKYSMAYLLRNNIDFRVFIGNKEVGLTTLKENIRGEDFDIICVDGVKTSVTTNMGGNAWKPWMIVRELWCNALDEGGHDKQITDNLFGEENKTTFYIQLTPEFKEVYNNWHDYFVHDLHTTYSKDNISLYPSGKDFRMYKQGVLIKTLENKGVFGYNYDNAALNELREFNGSISYSVFHSLIDLPVDLCRFFLENVTLDHYEGTMDWEWTTGNNLSNWAQCLGNKKLIHTNIAIAYLASGLGSLEDVIIVPKRIYDFFVKRVPSMGVTKVTGKGEFVESENYTLENKVNEIITNLIDCGYRIAPGVTISYGDFDNANVMARAEIESKEILLSHKLMQKTNHFITSTIIEENEHILTGYSDETRAFQQHFIDLYAKELLAKNNIKC